MGNEVPDNSGNQFGGNGCEPVLAFSWLFGSRIGLTLGTAWISSVLLKDWVFSGTENEILAKTVGIVLICLGVGFGLPALIEKKVGEKFEDGE